MYTLVTAFSVPERQFDADKPELIDVPDNDPDILADDLRNLRRINRLFGGWSAIRSQLPPILARLNGKDKISILDLATGSADHPVALSKTLTKSGIRHEITALDNNPQIVSIAQDRVRSHSSIRVEQQNILDLDYEDESFDIVLCSLVLHHFSQSDAIKLIHRINRLSRAGFIINDLNRSWIGVWITWLFTHLTSRNPMTRHDSYLSVLRGFTPDEIRSMGMKAGLKNFRVIRRPFFRLILAGEKNA